MRFSDATRVELSRALVLTGAVLYVPSNIVPVMTMSLVGHVEPLTVLGGVRELYDSGLPLIAGVVFLASIVVPFLKIVGLGWIVLLHGSSRNPAARTRLHRVIHTIGSWSMVDLFLLAVLASVGQLGALAGVRAEPGCLMFAAVVVCTLLAAEIYQPRLIWLSPKIPAS
jgi:paraquat-inducible protein A